MGQGEDTDYFCQGILSSEAAYIKDFHDVLHEMDSFGQRSLLCKGEGS